MDGIIWMNIWLIFFGGKKNFFNQFSPVGTKFNGRLNWKCFWKVILTFKSQTTATHADAHTFSFTDYTHTHSNKLAHTHNYVQIHILHTKSNPYEQTYTHTHTHEEREIFGGRKIELGNEEKMIKVVQLDS